MKSEWCVSVSFSSSIYWGGKRIKHFFYLCIRNPQKMQNHCKTNCLYQRNKSLGSSVPLLFRYSYCLHTVLLQTACQTFATLNQQDNCTPIQNKSSFPKKRKPSPQQQPPPWLVVLLLHRKLLRWKEELTGLLTSAFYCEREDHRSVTMGRTAAKGKAW